MLARMGNVNDAQRGVNRLRAFAESGLNVGLCHAVYVLTK
jgi:hypothetical protein